MTQHNKTEIIHGFFVAKQAMKTERNSKLIYNCYTELHELLENPIITLGPTPSDGVEFLIIVQEVLAINTSSQV